MGAGSRERSLPDDEVQALSRVCLDSLFVGLPHTRQYSLALQLMRQTTTLDKLEYLECHSVGLNLPEIQELISGCSQYLKHLALDFDLSTRGSGSGFLV